MRTSVLGHARVYAASSSAKVAWLVVRAANDLPSESPLHSLRPHDVLGSFCSLLRARHCVYEFDVVSNAFAVALVCSSVDETNSWGTLHYATTSNTALELGTPGSVCTTLALARSPRAAGQRRGHT
jgi:hypothetical protein